MNCGEKNHRLSRWYSKSCPIGFYLTRVCVIFGKVRHVKVFLIQWSNRIYQYPGSAEWIERTLWLWLVFEWFAQLLMEKNNGLWYVPFGMRGLWLINVDEICKTGYSSWEKNAWCAPKLQVHSQFSCCHPLTFICFTVMCFKYSTAVPVYP